MDGRISMVGACLLFACAGCITGGAQKTTSSPTPTPAMSAPPINPTVTAEAAAKKNDPKRTPRVVVAFAKFKEGEAKALDKEPEQQFKLRDQARQLYQEALKMDPACIEAHRGLGRVYVDLTDFPRAQETFQKAQAKFPKEPIFWFELGQMHNRRKDFPQAIECLNRALEMDQENRLYLTTLGFTLARAGQTEQSVALLTRSMGVASAHYNVGRMLIHLERTEEGIQYLRQAVQSNPNLTAARQFLSDLESGDRVNVNIDFETTE